MTNPNFDLYALPNRVKEQAEKEYEYFKKMYPHLSEEQLLSMALSASGAPGRHSQLLYPKYHNAPYSE